MLKLLQPFTVRRNTHLRSSSLEEQFTESSNRHRTPESMLQKLDPELRASYSPAQLQAIKELLQQALPKPAPKLVDLRFEIDLLFTCFYFVLFVGKDQRQQRRRYPLSRVERWGNAVVVVIMLLSLNLIISLSILLLVYLVKSFVGIDVFPDQHLGDVIQKI